METNIKKKGAMIMLNKLKELKGRIKERKNLRKKLLTDSEFLEEYADLLTKKEKEMYARLYRD